MEIVIGSDHRGFSLKSELLRLNVLGNTNVNWHDVGAFEYNESDDYVDIAQSVVSKMHESGFDRSVVICGSGVGVSIVMNRYDGIRCALTSSAEQAAVSRTDDDCNVLALGADFLDSDTTHAIVWTFMTTPYVANERFERRLQKIETIGGVHEQ